MSRVIAAYDLDEDHGRLWVNADLKRIPEIVVVANQPMDRAQTVTYVPEARLLEALEENKRVQAENAKMRELVLKYGEYTSQDRCEGCVCKSRCNDGDVDECWQRTEIREMARKLGIELD